MSKHPNKFSNLLRFEFVHKPESYIYVHIYMYICMYIFISKFERSFAGTALCTNTIVPVTLKGGHAVFFVPSQAKSLDNSKLHG